jgi:hypothetical protein
MRDCRSRLHCRQLTKPRISKELRGCVDRPGLFSARVARRWGRQRRPEEPIPHATPIASESRADQGGVQLPAPSTRLASRGSVEADTVSQGYEERECQADQ